MARSQNEKNWAADIPKKLHAQLMDWMASHPKVSNRQMMEAQVRLFLSLDDDAQARALFGAIEAEPLDARIRRIVAEQLAPLMATVDEAAAATGPGASERSRGRQRRSDASAGPPGGRSA